MEDNQAKIDQLLNKLDTLLQKQDAFSREVNELRNELHSLKITPTEKLEERQEIKQSEPAIELRTKEIVPPLYPANTGEVSPPKAKRPQPVIPPSSRLPKFNLDLEKFIGENLISKIGIIITVIGVGIGAKYSIENDLISPLTRIILGYLAGLGLLGFGIKLKEKYESFSAVLVSGAMAIMYFITFSAYSFYDLISQTMAFALMVIFTAFTVFAALQYKKQVIAHIGLVGAYGVPFLLSEGSGNYTFLFSYMAIINVGVLAIAVKKYWKALNYTSFGLTWLVFMSWFVLDYQVDSDYALGLTFLSIFFIIFYLTFLAYKLVQKEKFVVGDIILVLLNSFIFFGLGYAMMHNHETGQHLLGVFTLANAVVHFAVSRTIYQLKLADKSLLHLILGLVLVFITIAIPVQLDGNWVTLLWAGEAALLFWIGRTKDIPFYEKLAYPLMILAFFSIAQDWSTTYRFYDPELPETRVTPLLNINFLTSILFIAAFGFINYINRNSNYTSALAPGKSLSKIMSFLIPAILLYVIYCAFYMEIECYWDQLYRDSSLTITSEGEEYPRYFENYDLMRFKSIWVLNYALLFVSVLAFVNLKKIKNQLLGFFNMGLIVLAIGAFLTGGIYELGTLRDSYLEQSMAEYYHSGAFNIGIRYISFALVGLALFSCYKYIRQDFIPVNLRKAYYLLLHITVLWMASSELINWMDIAGSTASDKLGLSILWGVYALFLIALGIRKNKKHLRIGAIVLFGITLLKLFFYDISHLNTISKTIVFVSLGVLLLIISFLYNKYKHLIADEMEE